MDRPFLLSLPFHASSKEAAGFFQASSNEKAGCFQASSNETGCLFSVSSDETEGCFQAESSEMGAKVAGAFSAAGWVGRGSNRAGFVFSSGKKEKRLTWWFQESSPHPHLQITWTHSQSPHIRIMHTSWQLFWELLASWLSANREKNWENPHLQWWKVNDLGHVLSHKQTDRPTDKQANKQTC